MQYRSEDGNAASRDESESEQGGSVPQTRLRRGRSVLDKYRCDAVSVTGFVQRLVDYLRHGYWFYVTGEVPADKDPREIDEKLLEKYRIAVCDTTRYRRKKAGLANMQYIRHCRFFVLLCTYGKHDFFLPVERGGEGVRNEREREVRIKDVRAVPIRHAGYSLSMRRGGNLRKLNPEDPPRPDGKMRVSVRINEKRYRDLKAEMMRLGLSRKRDVVEQAFRRLPFE